MLQFVVALIMVGTDASACCSFIYVLLICRSYRMVSTSSIKCQKLLHHRCIKRDLACIKSLDHTHFCYYRLLLKYFLKTSSLSFTNFLHKVKRDCKQPTELYFEKILSSPMSPQNGLSNPKMVLFKLLQKFYRRFLL